ncbi:MAG: hypothetical protein JNG86_17470, partial [Verrucomicrobiaceae bacterium]|nr:hypothetical protein [Verrucomicrobiaceae bacterium]
MSKPTDLRASRILLLHQSLRDAAADFARRSELIARDTRSKRYTAEQNHLQQYEKLDAEAASISAEATSQWQAHADAVRARHNARATSFQRYQNRIERDLPAMTQKERERWLGKQQFRRIQADSDRKKALAQTEAFAAPLAERLTAAKNRLLAVLKATGGRLARQGEVQPAAFTLSDMPARVETIEAHAQTLENQLATKTGGLLGMFSKSPVDLQQLSRAVHDYETAVAELNAAVESAYAAVEADFAAEVGRIDAEKGRVEEIARTFRDAMNKRLATQIPACLARNERLLKRNLQRVDAQLSAHLAQLTAPAIERRNQLENRHRIAMETMDAAAQKRWDELQTEWNAKIPSLLAQIDELSPIQSAPWSSEYTPTTVFPPHSRFAALKLDLSKEAAVLEKDSPLRLDGHEHVSLPLALTFPQEGSLLIETDDDGG